MVWRSAHFSRSTTCCGHMLLQVDAVSRQRCQSSGTNYSISPNQGSSRTIQYQHTDPRLLKQSKQSYEWLLSFSNNEKEQSGLKQSVFPLRRCLLITQTTWPAITVIILADFCWILGHAKEQTSHDSGGGHKDKYYCLISMDFWTVAWTQTHGFG